MARVQISGCNFWGYQLLFCSRILVVLVYIDAALNFAVFLEICTRSLKLLNASPQFLSSWLETYLVTFVISWFFCSCTIFLVKYCEKCWLKIAGLFWPFLSHLRLFHAYHLWKPITYQNKKSLILECSPLIHVEASWLCSWFCLYRRRRDWAFLQFHKLILARLFYFFLPSFGFSLLELGDHVQPLN